MSLILRRAEYKDADGIIQVHIDSIRDICSNDYNPQEIAAWISMKFKPEVWRRRMDRDHLWVIEDDGVIRGFSHFAILDSEEGEIMGLYLTRPILKKGFGKKLFFEIKKLALENRLRKLTILSTLTAKTFYESFGFLQTSSDTSIEINGLPISCHPMALELNILSWNSES